MDSDYADDLAVMDNTEEGLQESTDLIAYYTSHAGLKINAKKTQCMAISKCASQRPYTERDSIMLPVEGEPVEQVSNFVYLGANISWDGTIDRDLDYKAAVITILLYGEEVLRRAGIKSIETFIGSARLRWYGHVARMPETRLPNFLLDWKPNYGKRLRGRPRKGWMACVLEDAAVFTGVDNINRDAVKQLALKRVEWRNMLHRRRDVCDAGHSND